MFLRTEIKIWNAILSQWNSNKCDNIDPNTDNILDKDHDKEAIFNSWLKSSQFLISSLVLYKIFFWHSIIRSKYSIAKSILLYSNLCCCQIKILADYLIPLCTQQNQWSILMKIKKNWLQFCIIEKYEECIKRVNSESFVLFERYVTLMLRLIMLTTKMIKNVALI